MYFSNVCSLTETRRYVLHVDPCVQAHQICLVKILSVIQRNHPGGQNGTQKILKSFCEICFLQMVISIERPEKRA